MNINDGKTHTIVFVGGKLYLDDIQIAGKGMKDATVNLTVNTVKESGLLEINVSDSITSKSIGPGQMGKR